MLISYTFSPFHLYLPCDLQTIIEIITLLVCKSLDDFTSSCLKGVATTYGHMQPVTRGPKFCFTGHKSKSLGATSVVYGNTDFAIGSKCDTQLDEAQ